MRDNQHPGPDQHRSLHVNPHHLLEARRQLVRAEEAASEARARFFAAVLEAHEAGATLAEIGKEMGVSRVRVHQMVTVARDTRPPT